MIDSVGRVICEQDIKGLHVSSLKRTENVNLNLLSTTCKTTNGLITEIKKITATPPTPAAKKQLIEWAISKMTEAAILGTARGFQCPEDQKRYQEYHEFIDHQLILMENAIKLYRHYIAVFQSTS